MRCKAIANSTGEQCRKNAVTGREYCRSHKGYVAAGTDHWNYKHGGYSKVIPHRLLETYEEVLENDRRNELTHEIALSESRLRDLLGRVDSGESGALWKNLRGMERRLRKMSWGIENADAADLLCEMLGVIRGGYQDYRAWEDAERWIARKTRLVESERRRAVEDEEMIRADEALALAAEWTQIVRTAVEKYVGDPRQAQLVHDFIAAQIGGGQGFAHGPGADGRLGIGAPSPN